MRWIFGFVSVCALCAVPLVGCSETGGESGSGGTAGTGGAGATGGTASTVRVSFIGDSITEQVGTPENPVN